MALTAIVAQLMKLGGPELQRSVGGVFELMNNIDAHLGAVNVNMVAIAGRLDVVDSGLEQLSKENRVIMAENRLLVSLLNQLAGTLVRLEAVLTLEGQQNGRQSGLGGDTGRPIGG